MSTGALLHNTHIMGDAPVEPISSNGVLYVSTDNDGGNLAAIRESDTSELWDFNTGNGPSMFSGGRFTLNRGVLTSFDSCGNGVGFSAANGAAAWAWDGICGGGWMLLGVAAGNRVWFGDPIATEPWDNSLGNIVVVPGSGRIVGTFPAGTSPIFADGIAVQDQAVTANGGQDLVGINPGTNKALWRFTGTGGNDDIATLPLAADGNIFVARTSGVLYAVNPTNGQVVWSAVPPANAGSVGQGWGLAAGDGHLVELTTQRVLIYSGAGYPSSTPPTAWSAAPADPAEPLNTALPHITGTLTEGRVVSVVHGTWTQHPTSYTETWWRCDATGYACNQITSAAGTSYTLTATDVGSTLRISELATNAVGSVRPVFSDPTGVVAASSTTARVAAACDTGLRARGPRRIGEAVPQLTRRRVRHPA